MISPRSGLERPSRAAARLLVCVGLTAAFGCRVDDDRPPAAKAESFEPLPAEPGRFVSADGRVSVPLPAGDGWECLEETHGDGPAAALAVRCRRADPSQFLFVAAKTHRQPADQRVDAETLLMTLYRADNEAFFESVEYVSNGPTSVAGAPGWESELEATHARLGTIHKRERVAIVGDRVFAISAEGGTSLWRAHAPVLDDWFDEVRFAR